MKITVEYAKEVIEKIDSTLLRPDAVSADIEKLCADAAANGFKAVCVNPVNVPACKAALKETQVKVCTVVGFPLGEDLTKVKLFETKRALKAGADEIDMVMCISAAKMGRWDYIGKEIKKITKMAKSAVVKVIIETCYLTESEIKQACEVAVRSGARFVKTSTGYGPAGAKLENVELMHNTVTEVLKTFKQDDARCEIKAAGGIKTFEQAKAYVEAGATRIGTSAGMEIVAQSLNFSGGVKKAAEVKPAEAYIERPVEAAEEEAAVDNYADNNAEEKEVEEKAEVDSIFAGLNNDGKQY